MGTDQMLRSAASDLGLHCLPPFGGGGGDGGVRMEAPN